VLGAMTGQDDWAQMVHHAVKADDPQSIIEFAPRAARSAVAAGSHRQALSHFRILEPHLGLLPPSEQAALAGEWARTEHRLDTDAAVGILDRAISLHRSAGDDQALARMLAFAVRVYEVNGRPEEAEACSIEAVSLLATRPPSRDLAYALSQRALLKLMIGDDDAEGLEVADRAIAMAEATGDDLTVIRALGVKGAIAHSSHEPAALELVEDAYQRAVKGGYWYEETYALVNMAGLTADIRQVDRALDLVQKAVQAAARYEIRNLETYALAMLAEILVWRGDWAAAEDTAIEVLGGQPHAESVAWRMLALLQARRGRSEAAGTIERMWAMADGSGELQQIDPAASVLAEYMWLTATMDSEHVRRVESALGRSLHSGFAWPSGPLAFWMWKLGLLASIPDRVAAPYRQIAAGEWRAASQFWDNQGVPYERALALMHGDEVAQLQAVEIFESLGATAAARRWRRDLLDQGVRVPRGRARATRRHGAGLTARQAEVLEQLAAGLSNAEIADRLFVSHRTVENHVSAILMKLDVANRVEAVDTARSRGLLAGG
jgi:DNA-binding CsgD family transcriptional regulator/tetratricopeptide (TPR) repeat protein